MEVMSGHWKVITQNIPAWAGFNNTISEKDLSVATVRYLLGFYLSTTFFSVDSYICPPKISAFGPGTWSESYPGHS